MITTCSFHHGTEYVPSHNRREKKAEKEAHIDENGIHFSWIDEEITVAYDRLFGEALKEYNEKQKRKDRRIKSYLQNVRQNSKLRDVYECIVQVGNEKNHPAEEISRQILKEYLDEFQAKNPSLSVIGAYYHADEVGETPHLHLDYIPVANGKKTGLKVRNNLTEALKTLGYESEYIDQLDDNGNPKINEKTGKPYQKLHSAEMKFQEAERIRLAEISKKYGIEIQNPHKAPSEYSSSKQLREARNQRITNEKKERELTQKEAELNKKEEEVEVILNQKKEVEEEKQNFEVAKAEAESYVLKLDEEIKPLPELEKVSNIGSAERLEENFPLQKTGTFTKESAYEYGNRQTKNLWKWFKTKFYDPLKDKCNKLMQSVKALKQENSLQKARINALERENQALNQSVDQIVDQRLKERSEAIFERGREAERQILQPKVEEYERFLSGEKTVFKFPGDVKITCLSGVNSVKNAWLQLDDYERLTPYGLEQLAKRMKSRGFEDVGEAREYARKNKFESIVDITEKTGRDGYGERGM